jgi:hypothetical protein
MVIFILECETKNGRAKSAFSFRYDIINKEPLLLGIWNMVWRWINNMSKNYVWNIMSTI